MTWNSTDTQTAQAIREHSAAIAKEILAVEFGEGAGSVTVEVNQAQLQYALARRG